MNILNLFNSKNKEIQRLENLIEDMVVNKSKNSINITDKQTNYRYRQLFSDWIPALQQAESVERPSRRLLLDIFKTIETDAKVTGKIQNRINTTVLQDFVIKKDGEKQDDLIEFFEQKWFRDLTYDILESKFYGFTVLDLIEVKDNIPKFKSVDRFYVQPVGKQILKSYMDIEGYNISDLPFTLFIGEERDLGLYAKISQYVLYKKTLLTLAMEYSERYGTPFRFAKVGAGSNQKQVWDMLKKVGAHGFGVFSENDDISELANHAGTGETIYERLINWCDDQISFLISGETMTQDQGSSYAQANIHQKTADKTSYLDNLFVQDVVNDQIIPFLIDLGFTELQGCKFEFHFDTTLAASEQINIDAQLMQHFDLDVEYLEERYNTKIKGRKEAAPSPFGNLDDIEKLKNEYKLKW